MALNLSTTLASGLAVTNAYAKVLSFQGTAKNTQFVLGFYASQAARTGNKPVVSTQNFSCATPQNGPAPAGSAAGTLGPEVSILTGLYAYLHTLPEFAGATDC